jgi:hypothetical protein
LLTVTGTVGIDAKTGIANDDGQVQVAPPHRGLRDRVPGTQSATISAKKKIHLSKSTNNSFPQARWACRATAVGS